MINLKSPVIRGEMSSLSVIQTRGDISSTVRSNKLTKEIIKPELDYSKESYLKSAQSLQKRYEAMMYRKIKEDRVDSQINRIMMKWGRDKSHSVSLQLNKFDRKSASVSTRGYIAKKSLRVGSLSFYV